VQLVHNPRTRGRPALISDLDDLERFFRALLGGRLLPARLLAEMTTPVDIGVPGFGYGLGLVVVQAPLIQAPSGRLVGHDGGIAGFLNIVLSTQDGRRQLGVMLNELVAPPAVVEAYLQAWTAIATQRC
jgi:D-alanyl-D-alanine carboxypeptidase